MQEQFKIENEEMVIIELPKFAIPKKQAKEYILAFNKFSNDMKNEIILEDSIYHFNQEYIKGKFIPVVKKIEDYSQVLSKLTPNVEQIDRYILAQQSLSIYENEQQIFEMWTNKEQEEQKEEVEA